MDYLGLTEEEMLDVIIDAEPDMNSAKEELRRKLKSLATREEEIEKRMKHFETTYFLRKVIAVNNRRIAEILGDELDEKKKNLFL